ncbi:MAG: Uma2 family endonuclease [Armatimonadetes bacterium]|nr:Uma2 family endonuclease [Armatimonadota bacterium]
MTFEEFLEWANEDTWAEWVDGEVIPMSPVNKLHQLLGGFLYTLINLFVDHHQLGQVYYEPFQMKTGPDLPGRSPDILFVAKDHLSRVKQNYLDGPADLVVEIISPDSGPRDRGEKFYEYEKGGVKEYWLLDPQRKKAEFYRLGPDGYYHQALLEGTLYHSDVLKGLWLDAAWLWQEPLPSLTQVLKEWKLI